MANTTLTHLFPQNFLADGELHKSLNEEFKLCDSGNLTFHWADFNETCEAVQEHIKNDPKLREDFRKREEGLNKLSLIPVWVKARRKVYQRTMYELYESHILNKQQHIGGIDPYETIEVSFISGGGPFKSMSIAECFSKITYQDFILVNLLKGKLPKRNFRLRLKAKVLVEFGDHFNEARLINLEQMSTSGLLFSMDSNFFMRELSRAKSMRLLLDTEVLKLATGLPLEKLKEHLSQHTFNLMYSSKKEDSLECALDESSSQSSFDFFKSRKVFVFTSFDSLSKNSPQNAKVLTDFIDYARGLIREQYKLPAANRKTA